MFDRFSTHTFRDRVAGGLVSLVAGDAMGFDARNRHPRGDGGGSLPRGPWTLHAALALASAASIADRGWDLDDMMERFWRSWDRGEETAAGRPVGAGRTTREAILRFGSGASVFEAGLDDDEAIGCGALPRVYPVALHAAAEEPEEALLRCRDAASLTHRHDQVTGCCAAYGLILRSLLEDGSLDAAVEEACERLRGWIPDAERSRLRSALGDAPLPDPRLDDPVHAALSAALRCAGEHGDDLEGGIGAAVDRGGRAEVVAAVTGSLIGVRIGLGCVPGEWLAALPRAERVRDRGEALGDAVARRIRDHR